MVDQVSRMHDVVDPPRLPVGGPRGNTGDPAGRLALRRAAVVSSAYETSCGVMGPRFDRGVDPAPLVLTVDTPLTQAALQGRLLLACPLQAARSRRERFFWSLAVDTCTTAGPSTTPL